MSRLTWILFGVAVAGQWLFVVYIVSFYGGAVLSGALERINQQLPHGVIEGDTIGNAALAVHISLAAVIIFGGPLQFIPAIRNRFPVFHRWNGRIFLSTAFVVAGAGMLMNIIRGAHGGTTAMLGAILNTGLIVVFGVLAWRMAMRRNFAAHKKWAIRAFLMVNGVWFFRVGYGLWLLITGFKAPGANADLTGPFDIFLQFGHSLVPLLLLEGYFFVRNHASLAVKRAGAAALILLTLMLIGGLAILTMVFWFPQA